MRVGCKGDFDGYVAGHNDSGHLVVITDRADEYGPVFIGWVPLVADALGGELRKVQYGNPKELSLIAVAYADFTIHAGLLKTLAPYRISNRQWFVRSRPVEELIAFMRGNGED